MEAHPPLLALASVPARPIVSLSALRRIELHTAEALPECLGILRFRETVHMKPLPVINGVASCAEREFFAEGVNPFVAAILARACRQRDLMRPASVNGGRRQLAL